VCVCVCVWPKRSDQGASDTCVCMHTPMATGHTHAQVHPHANVHARASVDGTECDTHTHTHTHTHKVINIRVPEIVVSAVLDDGPSGPASTLSTDQKGLSLKVLPLICKHHTLAACSLLFPHPPCGWVGEGEGKRGVRGFMKLLK
jgi:hypothetical protein